MPCLIKKQAPLLPFPFALTGPNRPRRCGHGVSVFSTQCKIALQGAMKAFFKEALPIDVM